MSDAAFLAQWLDAVLDAKSPRTREGYRYVVRKLSSHISKETGPLSG